MSIDRSVSEPLAGRGERRGSKPKALIVSLYHPELVRGGAQQVAFEVFHGLREGGRYDPILLAAIDPSFAALYKTGARITGFDGRPGEYLFLSQDYDYWWHKNGDVRLREGFAEFLQLTRPDVVHFHHFLLLGLDLISLTRRVLPDARIILTFHEFLAICAADGQMVRRTDRSLCANATSVRCHQCFPDRRPEEFFMRELWVKSHLEKVDLFTTPSHFMIENYVRWGVDRSSIMVVPNGQDAIVSNEELVSSGPRKRNRFGFFGQFVDNKGVHVILEAVQLLRAEGFEDFQVELNGDNLKYASEARRKEIEGFIEAERKLPPAKRKVTMNGSYHSDQVGDRMARVDWVIVPSVWWEIFCLVISEAWLNGRPVIASNVGGPAERIRDGVDGLLFNLGDARALAATMKRAVLDETLWTRLASGIRPPPHRQEMIDGYTRAYEATI